MPVNACTVRPPAKPLSASDQATVNDITTKVGTLINNQFGGDRTRAFNAYAPGGQASSDDVSRLLKDAGFSADGFGSGIYRGIVANALVDKFDTNCDGRVSLNEFQAGLRPAGR